MVSIKNTYLYDNIINTVGRSHPISNMCDIICIYWIKDKVNVSVFHGILDDVRKELKQ